MKMDGESPWNSWREMRHTPQMAKVTLWLGLGQQRIPEKWPVEGHFLKV